jgi:hypothetical protein
MKHKTLRRAAGFTAALLTLVLLTGPDALAQAAVMAAPKNLPAVIQSITTWLVGLLVSLATLFLTVGGIRYLLAGGDPGEVAKAKDTLKYAAIGYGVAALAPVLVTILKGFVGV